MEEQLIKYKTSRLAKGKGFDEYIQQFYLEESEDEEVWEDDETMDMYEDDEIFYAPTQTLLQKWLREIHNIIVIPDYDVNTKDFFYWVITDGETRGIKRDSFKTYEEAFEKGYKKGLI